MHLHKELQQQNTENKQVWPEQPLRIGVALIFGICNQGTQTPPFHSRSCVIFSVIQ